MKTNLFRRTCSCSLGILATVFSAVTLDAEDVTADLVDLGNPNTYLTKQDGRNVWDMQVFDGKIYVGGGSTVTNAGPVKVIAYNPASVAFETELLDNGVDTFGTEAIDTFRVLDGELYLPNSDARSPSPDRSKYWKRNSSGDWTEYLSTGALATAHIRDMIRLSNGRILGVGNSRNFDENAANWKPGAVTTIDGGATFEAAVTVENSEFGSGWFFGVFQHGGAVFASSRYFSPLSGLEDFGVFRWAGAGNGFIKDPNWTNSDFVPVDDTIPFEISFRPFLPVEAGGALVYPLRTKSVYNANIPGTNTGYYQLYNWKSEGFIVKPSPSAAPVTVVFPDADAVGEDVNIRAGEVYALAVKRNDSTDFVNYLYTNPDPAGDPQGWREVLRFDSQNRAKSFEILDGKVYFGMGNDFGDPRGIAGKIYQVDLPAVIEIEQIEASQLNSSSWTTVDISQSFNDPIVVVGTPTRNGNQPMTMRVRNVGTESFQLQLDEWDYLDGGHTSEIISYLIAEKGVQTIDGVTVEAGRVTGVDENWKAATFTEPIVNPVIICQTVTRFGPAAVTTRVRNLTSTGFEVRVQEEQADGPHANEEIHFIALSESDIDVNGIRLKAGNTPGIDHRWGNLPIGDLGVEPALFGQISSFNGPDPAALRIRYNGPDVDTFVEEEKSADEEITHVDETVSWIAVELP